MEAAAAEYATRIRRYAPLTEVVLRPNPRGVAEPDAQREGEGERVLRALAPTDRVVLLDERGGDLSSHGAAQSLPSLLHSTRG